MVNINLVQNGVKFKCVITNDAGMVSISEIGSLEELIVQLGLAFKVKPDKNNKAFSQCGKDFESTNPEDKSVNYLSASYLLGFEDGKAKKFSKYHKLNNQYYMHGWYIDGLEEIESAKNYIAGYMDSRKQKESETIPKPVNKTSLPIANKDSFQYKRGYESGSGHRKYGYHREYNVRPNYRIENNVILDFNDNVIDAQHVDYVMGYIGGFDNR